MSYGGTATRFNGRNWTTPVVADPGGGLASISCPVAGTCFALGAGGAIEYSHGHWGPPVAVSPGQGLDAISCSSSSFCVAVGGSLNGTSGDASVYTGHGWSLPTPVNNAETFDAVSCASSTYCAATDAYGNVFSFDGQNWSGPVVLPVGSNSLGFALATVSISCPSTGTCRAVDEYGQAYFEDAGVWTGPMLVDFTVGFFGMSCPQANFCMTVENLTDVPLDLVGSTVRHWNGRSWEVGPSDKSLGNVSCSSTSFCVVINGAGRYYEWTIT